MKKFLILMLSIAVLTACSNDDDGDNTETEKILGTWFLVEANNAPFEVNDCTSQSNITFNEDNSAITEFHSTVEGECVSNTDETTWSKTSTKYTFDVPTLGPVTGTVTFNSSTKFTFVPDISPTTSLVFEK